MTDFTNSSTFIQIHRLAGILPQTSIYLQDQNTTTTETGTATTGISAFAMLKLVANIKWIAPQSNITVLTDGEKQLFLRAFMGQYPDKKSSCF
jgi:hypothetical protein